MARSPYSSTVVPETLFGQERSSGFTSSQFWVSVVRYKPILLVGGVWLVLICLAAFAYNRLMFTGTPPEPVADSTELQARSQPLASPNSEPVFGTSPLEADSAERGFTAPVDSLAERQPQPLVPIWSVGLLVGVCALSCFGLSTGVQASRRRAKRAALKPKAPSRSLKASKPGRRLPTQPAQPVRLSPYSAERDGMLVPTPQPKRPRSPQLSPPVRTKTPRRSRRMPPALTPPSQAVTGNLARKVAVVPEGQRHPLDWQESSLADNLDLRQRRSLSSLL